MNSRDLVDIINTLGIVEEDISDLPDTITGTLLFVDDLFIYNSQDIVKNLLVAIIEKVKENEW